MPAAIGAVIAVGLYLFACFWVLGAIVVPVLPYVVLGGVACGLLVALTLFAGTLLGASALAPDLVSHRDVAKRLPAKRTETGYGRDEAWPHYLFAQARTDLATAFGNTSRFLAGMWTRTGRATRDNAAVLFFWPLLVLPLVWMILMTVVAAAGALAAGLLLGVLLAGSLVVLVATAYTLRGLDLGLRRLRRAKATCPHPGCNHRSMLPAFRCGCGQVHHDLRPGRQGVLRRRCACGRSLPTTVLLASAAGLVAVCQECRRPLHPGSATLTDVVVPVFGATSAGKTRLVYAGMVALARHTRAVGGTLQPVGTDSEATLDTATKIVDSGRQTTKTAADAPPAITVRIGVGRRKAMLHLFDAAGESFAERSRTVELSYLADTQGLVFVLDPFSIPEVISELGADRAALADARPATLDPEQSYLVTAQWLRDRNVALDRLPLAVAVVKSDLLLELHPGTGLGPDATSADVEAWLRGKALDNLADGAERDFGAVRYFLVSSLDDITSLDGLAVRTSPARPLLWLLGRSGMPIAEQKEAASS